MQLGLAKKLLLLTKIVNFEQVSRHEKKTPSLSGPGVFFHQFKQEPCDYNFYFSKEVLST
jgi:hypothetical protein